LEEWPDHVETEIQRVFGWISVSPLKGYRRQKGENIDTVCGTTQIVLEILEFHLLIALASIKCDKSSIAFIQNLILITLFSIEIGH